MASPKTGPYKDQLTKELGPCIRVCHFNIEGISRAKCQVLHRLLKENDIDLVAIQETHAESKDQLSSRGNIPGYDLLGATYDRAYGVATYVRANIENASVLSTSTMNNIHEVTVKIGNITVANVYKPPAIAWPAHVLNPYEHPATYVGDFNSHHEMWKYSENDGNGMSLVEWTEEHGIHLLFDAKDRGTFRSAAWKREYNPDLCFVTNDSNGQPLPASRKVMPDFPHSQHRPVIIKIGTSIPVIRSFPRPRWNFKKANWTIFSDNLNKTLGWIPPKGTNYERLKGAIISAAKAAIPRGYRKEYIPGWSDESEKLYERFCEDGKREIADELLHSIDAARREKWTETVENLDFQKSSRQAWSLLRKLGGSNPPDRPTDSVTPNQVASHIVSTSRAAQNRLHTTKVKKDLKALKSTCAPESEYSNPFTCEEITKALEEMKTGKAPGFDGIHAEFLKHSGKYTRQWLAEFFSDIIQTGNVPHQLKRAKIVAILKPGKTSDSPKNYRPIALLSMLYKLLERLLYNRISQIILQHIPVEQAGFRPNRSCTDQVLALTNYVETAFQKQRKTAAVFIDLSAAYDTVWRQGVIFKLMQVIPCRKTADVINAMLSNRCFQVIMGDKTSTQMKLNNGLPQGSVLAPLLFSLYIADMPKTTSKKFGYADDWALATSHKDLDITEQILTKDLATLGSYFRYWRLQPNAVKTEVSCFHLNNKLANHQLKIHFEGRVLCHNRFPKYLGVTLDRTLSFKEHLTKTTAKLRTRNNILQKLCGTTWGSSASTLRSTALGLVYPVAEYCAPVWLNSSHTKRVDVQLNQTMRIISGTITATPTYWLPALSHIAPPKIRREQALVREYNKINADPVLRSHVETSGQDISRLRSRNPPLKTAKILIDTNFNITERWKDDWEKNAMPASRNMPCVVDRPEGFDQPRRIWATLNRIRTGCGRCADSFFRWGKILSPSCDCGAERQTVKHLVEECPIRSYGGDPSDFLFATKESIDYICGLDVCL